MSAIVLVLLALVLLLRFDGDATYEDMGPQAPMLIIAAAIWAFIWDMQMLFGGLS